MRLWRKNFSSIYFADFFGRNGKTFFSPQGVDHENAKNIRILEKYFSSQGIEHEIAVFMNDLENFYPIWQASRSPKTKPLWKISLFSPSKGRQREKAKIAAWMKFIFRPSRGRARKAGFYALSSKIFIFGSESEPSSRCLIYEAPNRSHFSSVASKLMPFSGAGFPLWH